MSDLNGTWIYRSFYPKNGEPLSLEAWTPQAALSVKTDATGKVAGKLTIPLPPGAPMPELELTISGSITPATEQQPEGVKLTGDGGRGSVNELRGYFVAGGLSPVIVGTIVAVRNDPAGQLDGTSGSFVLVRAQ